MMMEIEDVQWPKTLFDNTEPRQPGIHLSDVTRDLINSSGLGYKGGGFTDMQLTAEIGLLWEDVLSLIMARKYATRPVQVREDGIWMSLDGICPDPKGEYPLVVEEYKAAWSSARKTPDQNLSYMMQVKSYCRAAGTPCAIMRIFHLMGDYRGSGPLYRVARFVFDDRELEANWQMIVAHKERMVTSGKIQSV